MGINLSDLSPRLRKQALKQLAEEDAQRKKTVLDETVEEEEKKEKKSKYHSRKVTVELEDGTQHTFDSLKEYGRYEELLLMQQAGEISDLEIQKSYELIPSQRDSKGKSVRNVRYLADFVYKKDGDTIVEDVKSPITRTQVYKVKKKLMLYVHGIDIKEI